MPSWNDLTQKIKDEDFTPALSSKMLLGLRKATVSLRASVTSSGIGWELGLEDVVILGCCKENGANAKSGKCEECRKARRN